MSYFVNSLEIRDQVPSSARGSKVYHKADLMYYWLYCCCTVRAKGRKGQTPQESAAFAALPQSVVGVTTTGGLPQAARWCCPHIPRTAPGADSRRKWATHDFTGPSCDNPWSNKVVLV